MTWAVFPGDKYMRAVVELLTEAAKPSGSERVMAVVGGALLEEATERTLKERLINDPAVKNLLDPERPLGNMAPQIDLLYLLGAFDDKTRKALKSLGSVRNFFAHHIDASFDSLDEDFVQAMKRLVLHEGRAHYPHHLFGPDSKVPLEPVTSRRDQFKVNLQLGLIALMRDRVGHHTHTNMPRTEQELLTEWPNRYADETPA
jgi:hypothetical protein